ncbi:MAG: hypothetical protein JWM40_2689 [Frankiales bacterium]|nr:hypothetical protein [Frankiales bacterium]
MAAEHKELSASDLLAVFGGAKGLFDSSVPVGVFILARFFMELNGAIAAAVVAGLMIVALRRVRGESLQQAFGGFFGLVIAVVIARSTGSGKGIFWPGIAITAFSGLVFLVSLLVKRPAIALGLTAIDPRYKVWQTHEALRRACYIATTAWCVSFFIRATVATIILLSVGDSDRDGLLILIVINAVKWPLIIGSALLTVALVKQAQVPAVEEP